MGVEDGWQQYLGKRPTSASGKSREHTLGDEQLSDVKIVAVDISIWMAQFVSMKECALLFCQEPRVPVWPVLRMVKSRVSYLQSVGLQPILVFDGVRHDMKESHAGAARKKLRDVAVATLNEILARADGSDMAAADKARKGIAYVREDIVAMVRKWCVDDKNV
jgi:hypothetical protein